MLTNGNKKYWNTDATANQMTKPVDWSFRNQKCHLTLFFKQCRVKKKLKKLTNMYEMFCLVMLSVYSVESRIQQKQTYTRKYVIYTSNTGSNFLI